MIERHGLCRQTAALPEVHAYAAGLEKGSRHHSPTALRIAVVASLADDLVNVVTETLAGCERTACLTVERGTVSARSRALLIRARNLIVRPAGDRGVSRKIHSLTCNLLSGRRLTCVGDNGLIAWVAVQGLQIGVSDNLSCWCEAVLHSLF